MNASEQLPIIVNFYIVVRDVVYRFAVFNAYHGLFVLQRCVSPISMVDLYVQAVKYWYPLVLVSITVQG